MLTARDKRFLKYWEEQKAGGKAKYLILYTIAWGFIITLIPMAVSVFSDIFGLYRFYFLPLVAAILLALAIAFSISLYTWNKNQAKERRLLVKRDQ